MNTTPNRIVTLIPSATEWICQLGMRDRLVGVSHDCDYPSSIDELPCVTRTRVDPTQSSRQIDDLVQQYSDDKIPLYDLVVDCITDLRPDLVLTQSLCNVCAVSQRDVVHCLNRVSPESQILDLCGQTFDGVLADARAIVEATGSREPSQSALDDLQRRIVRVRERVESRPADVPRPVVTLLEWTDPIFCSGHWTPELIQWAGGCDPLGRIGEPSRKIEFSELAQADPEILLVACCGMDQARTERELAELARLESWNELRCVANNQVHAFDGSAYFNRPGPRLVDALENVAALIDRYVRC